MFFQFVLFLGAKQKRKEFFAEQVDLRMVFG